MFKKSNVVLFCLSFASCGIPTQQNSFDSHPPKYTSHIKRFDNEMEMSETLRELRMRVYKIDRIFEQTHAASPNVEKALKDLLKLDGYRVSAKNLNPALDFGLGVFSYYDRVAANLDEKMSKPETILGGVGITTLLLLSDGVITTSLGGLLGTVLGLGAPALIIGKGFVSGFMVGNEFFTRIVSYQMNNLLALENKQMLEIRKELKLLSHRERELLKSAYSQIMKVDDIAFQDTHHTPSGMELRRILR